MRATRTIPARPVNDAAAVAAKIVALIVETLAPAEAIDRADVEAELYAAAPTIGLLAAAGHLRSDELVLVAGGLRLQIDIPVGENALAATESVSPPRGAATANTWTLHLPSPTPLGPVVNAAVRDCPHLTIEPAPDEPPAAPPARSAASSIDLSRLRDGSLR